MVVTRLEKAMAPHSSTLAWKIPWMDEPGRLQSMGSLRSDTTEQLHFHFSLSCIGEGNGNPLQCSCLENRRDGGAWWAAIYGVTQSWTRLKWLSSSSSSSSRIDGWKEKKFALNSFLLGQEAFNPVKPDSKVIQLIIQLYFWGCLTVIQGVYKKQILSQTLFP